MCNHGDEIILVVPIGPHWSCTGRFQWKRKGVDRCIAPLVNALNQLGMYTASSCCGHGEHSGSILLQDGREIITKQTTGSSATKYLTHKQPNYLSE